MYRGLSDKVTYEFCKIQNLPPYYVLSSFKLFEFPSNIKSLTLNSLNPDISIKQPPLSWVLFFILPILFNNINYNFFLSVIYYI